MQGPGIKRLYYSASDVCFIVGVKSHTLKSWEQKYGRPKPARNKSGRRLFKPRELEMAKRIKKLTDAGYSDEKIAYILDKSIPEGLVDLDKQIQESGKKTDIVREISDGLKEIMNELNESQEDHSELTG